MEFGFYYTFIVYQVCHDVDRCAIIGVLFVDPEVKSQWTVLVRYLTIYINATCYQTCIADDIYFFSNTAHALAYDARSTVQLPHHKILHFICPELCGPQKPRAEFSVDYKT